LYISSAIGPENHEDSPLPEQGLPSFWKSRFRKCVLAEFPKRPEF
jgi:hypothetical protein